ncbi:sulfotransferase domain-containing protein (plasmid) [Priestia aryabhattai]|uniref:sulfotransferase domain-containing protein n=1 Tax=Priestia TaxID=2800373 RepID=UPI00234EDAC6|nr:MULTISPECIES: sulfotransferase domain-containing protein [Priestia]MDC7724414.1 sulfotransferase domain-containing protein [Priestia megaterium]MDH3135498.1 sulfotransferase domain-containing protein [Priestia aryabhattai]
MKNSKTCYLPSFFVNSVPKSGTHLLKNLLQGMPNVSHNPKNEFYEGHSYQFKDHFYKLGCINPNEFGIGHVYYSHDWLHMLKRLNMKRIFITRDLRDVVVSYVYFILEKYPNHPLYNYLTNEVKSQKERYLAFINGVQTDDVKHPSILEHFTLYQGWLNDADTLSITFEDLISSERARLLTLAKIANYIWDGVDLPVPIDEMIERMEERMDGKYSLTFRSGKIGGWQDEFDEEVKDAFKEVAGDLLIKLKYEKDYEW